MIWELFTFTREHFDLISKLGPETLNAESTVVHFFKNLCRKHTFFSIALTPEAFAGRKVKNFKTKICSIKNKVFKSRHGKESEANLVQQFSNLPLENAPETHHSQEVAINSSFEILPAELIRMILQYLAPSELAHASRVNKRVNAIASDVLDTKFAKLEECYSHIMNLNPSWPTKINPFFTKEDFAKIIKELRQDVENLNRITSLSEEEIRGLLNRRKPLLQLVLDNTHQKNLTTLRVLILAKKENGNFDQNRAYLAAFLAEYMVNLSVVWNDSNWDAAWSLTKDTWHAWDASTVAAGYAAWSVTRDAWHAWDTTNTELSKLKLSKKIRKKEYQISELLALHRLEQNGSQYFEMAFNAAYETLIQLDQSVAIDETKKTIDEYLNIAEFSKIPPIQKLKEFLNEAEEVLRLE